MKKKLFMFSILTVLLFILSAIPVLAEDAGDFKIDKTGNFKYELNVYIKYRWEWEYY